MKKYSQTVKGMAVDKMVVRRPIDSISGPPTTPPIRAENGIKLPIQEAYKNRI